ncbi:hypothetical protein M434DRAFT_39089 [Hypoxylon sp. CO27-5]|nr:hypothetical protein M434DRAFT_39089 [Hypoxylon sp. CO27-5]
MKRFVKCPPGCRSHSHSPAHVAGVRIFIGNDHVSRVKPVPLIIIESPGYERGPGQSKVISFATEQTSENPSDDVRWYTSDEVKVKDCETFDSTGECDQWDLVKEEESDAGGLCDDCTREHDADA